MVSRRDKPLQRENQIRQPSDTKNGQWPLNLERL